MDADAFAQALVHALPPGLAVPNDARSVWGRVVRGLAMALAEHHNWVLQAVAEWQPHTTQQRLAEWEAALGLPDGCWGAAASVAQRRGVMLARLRGFGGAYADSSPAAPGTLVAWLASMGYTATVSYHHPFRAGRDRVGSRVGMLDGRMNVVVQGSTLTHPFRAGRDRVGSRLGLAAAGDEAALRCALERVVPARFAVLLTFRG